MADVSPAASTTSRVTRKSTHFSVVDAVRIDAESFRDRRACPAIPERLLENAFKIS